MMICHQPAHRLQAMMYHHHRQLRHLQAAVYRPAVATTIIE